MKHFRFVGVYPKSGKFNVPIITLNAVGEELFQKVTYQKAAMERRCLVLSSGFYECRHIFPKNKKTGLPLKTAIKYPYYITLPEKEYFYMAGIWTPWTVKNTGEYAERQAFSVSGKQTADNLPPPTLKMNRVCNQLLKLGKLTTELIFT